MRFGERRKRNGKSFTITINWDHRLPYSFSRNNYSRNFVAACQVCNGIKSDKIFQELDEAQIYIQGERKSKGYDF